MMNEQEVLTQSKRAFGQWENLWRKNAKLNKPYYEKSKRKLSDLLYRGMGRTILSIGFGNSYEKEIETIREMREKNKEFDVICADKCISFLGFAPDYCIIADASISADWLKNVDTRKTTLIANVCAKPEWISQWKGEIIFYVNKDNLESEKIFSGITGCRELMPASSNVGNAAIMLTTHVMNYDKVLLSGYDFCWKDNYYAFHNLHKDAIKEKKHWMAHRMTTDLNGDIVHTSENLLFSAKWLGDYLRLHPFPVFNTTRETILASPYINLKKQLKKSKFRSITEQEKNIILNRSIVEKEYNNIEDVLKEKDVFSYKVKILPEVNKWILKLST